MIEFSRAHKFMWIGRLLICWQAGLMIGWYSDMATDYYKDRVWCLVEWVRKEKGNV